MSNQLTVSCDGFDFSLFNPTQFRLMFGKLPHIPFFCQTVNIPSVTLGTAVAATPFHDLNLPGEKLTFSQFSADVLLDANMETYSEMLNWMKNLSMITSVSSDPTSFCQVMTGSKIFHFNDVYPIEVGPLRLSKVTPDSPSLIYTVIFNFTTFDLK